MLSKKNLLRILVNTLLGVVLIIAWVKLVNINEVLDTLSRINPWVIPLFALCFFLAGLLRSLRLKILLREFKIPLLDLLGLTFVSQLLSFLIPLRLGEVSKGVYLSANYPIVFTKSLVWIFLDRFMDFWIIIFLTGLFLLIIQTNMPFNFSLLIVTLGVLITIAMLIVITLPSLVFKLRDFFSSLILIKFLKTKFIKITDFFINTTSPLSKSKKETSLMILLTVLALISDAMGWLFIFKAFLGANLSFLKIWLGSMLSALTFLLPAAPGYVGSVEASTLAVFHYILGMDKNIVSAAGVLYHMVTIISVLFFGIASLYFLKFDINLVIKKFKKD